MWMSEWFVDRWVHGQTDRYCWIIWFCVNRADNPLENQWICLLWTRETAKLLEQTRGKCPENSWNQKWVEWGTIDSALLVPRWTHSVSEHKCKWTVSRVNNLLELWCTETVLAPPASPFYFFLRRTRLHDVGVPRCWKFYSLILTASIVRCQI
jgi:hypothetical protein